MRLTLRGWTVVAAVVAALAMSWRYGPRSLDVALVPLVAVLVAGVVSVARIDRPTVTRHAVVDGHAGDRRTVAVTVECDASAPAVVGDAVGDGLEAAREPVVETTLGPRTRLEYEVELVGRGRRAVGPLAVTVTDALGLVARRYDDDGTAPVVVYPPVVDLHGSGVGHLTALVDARVAGESPTFEYLREYRRGDALRDIHWKTTAKRPDDALMVAESAGEREAVTVQVAGEGPPGRADALASALASVVVHLLEAGATVGLTVGDDREAPTAGSAGRHALLERLALTGGGDLDPADRRAADVLVQADESGVTVVVDGRPIPFERLRADDAPLDGGDAAGSSTGAGETGSPEVTP